MKAKLISTGYSFTRFLLLSMATLTVLILIVLWELMNSTLTDLNRQTVSRQAEGLVEQMTNYLEVRLKELSTQSNYPVMVQGVMQPDANIGRLEDFLGSLYLQQTGYPLALLNFENQLIAQRGDTGLYQPIPDARWQQVEAQGKAAVFVSLYQGEAAFTLVAPVLYNGLVEGALSANIPVSKMLADLDMANKVEGLELLFQYREHAGFSVGAPLEVEAIPLEKTLYALSVSYRSDPEIVHEAILALLGKIAALLAVVAIVVTAIAVKFGRYALVKPLEAVTAQVRAIEQGEQVEQIQLDSNNKELNVLAEQFNQMTTQINKREQQLRAAYTQLKHSKDQLVQSEKMASVGTLAAGIAHEINNPISFVLSNMNALRQYETSIEKWHSQAVRYLQQHTRLSTEQQQRMTQKLLELHAQQDFDEMFDDIESILKDSDDGLLRVKEIVQSLKGFAHKTENSDAPFSLRACIERSVNLVWNELKYTCRVHQTIEHDCEIKGSENQISQVLINLLVNAGQAIEGSGDIHIKLSRQNGYARLLVVDTGKGIEAENLTEIFNPFYTSKPVGVGTGLGLSISYSIIESHGGSIEVQSKPGKGTGFTILLPLVEESTEAPALQPVDN